MTLGFTLLALLFVGFLMGVMEHKRKMATRIFCDHCGNTIQNPQVFIFGPRVEYFNQQAAQNAQQMQYTVYAAQQAQASLLGAANYGGGGGGGYVTIPAPSLPPKPLIAMEQVDLCQHCVPIWMKRVKNLTAASDVQPPKA